MEQKTKQNFLLTQKLENLITQNTDMSKLAMSTSTSAKSSNQRNHITIITETVLH